MNYCNRRYERLRALTPRSSTEFPKRGTRKHAVAVKTGRCSALLHLNLGICP
jgi:hypothetical protein